MLVPHIPIIPIIIIMGKPQQIIHLILLHHKPQFRIIPLHQNPLSIQHNKLLIPLQQNQTLPHLNHQIIPKLPTTHLLHKIIHLNQIQADLQTIIRIIQILHLNNNLSTKFQISFIQNQSMITWLGILYFIFSKSILYII